MPTSSPESSLVHLGIRSVLDLLYNPFHVGVRSPDWRRMLLERVLTLTGRRFGMFHLPTCSVAPATVVHRPLKSGRRPEELGSARFGKGHEGFHNLSDFAGNGGGAFDSWEEMKGKQIPDGLPSRVPVPSGSVYMRFRSTLQGGTIVVGPPRGVPAQPLGESAADQVLSILGDLLVRWEDSDPGPLEIALLSRKPLRNLPSYPHPAVVVGPLGNVVFRNSAAEAASFAYDEEWGTLRRLCSDGSGVGAVACVRDLPTLPGMVEGENGERFRIFRLPLNRGAELLTGFIAVPMPPALPISTEVMAFHGLSAREAEVALSLAQGLSTKAIAKDLDISWHTARGHVSRVLKKLGVNSRKLIVHRMLRHDD